MTPSETSTRARIRRGLPGLTWTCILLVALAALSTADLQAQEWRFEAIDRRFADQKRDTDWRFNHLDQRLQRLHKELSDHRLSHQEIWRTQGLVTALHDIVRGLRQEVAYLRRLIQRPQPSHPFHADIRRLPL